MSMRQLNQETVDLIAQLESEFGLSIEVAKELFAMAKYGATEDYLRERAEIAREAERSQLRHFAPRH
jgi:hypothetical protein